MQKIIPAISLIIVSANCYAFQACPSGTRPCASVSQVLLYVVLPTLVFLAIGVFCKVKIQNDLLRKGSIVLVFMLWIIVVLVALGAFGGFLAPCSSTCWYGFSS